MGAVKYLSFTTKRKFGVEIEVTNHIKREKLKEFVAAVDPKRECKVSNANDKDYGNNYWKLKHDGSCKDKDFAAGSELSSFVGSGMADIALVGQVVEKFQKESVKVNDNCAIHVHAEVSDFTTTQLGKLVALWMKIEPVMLQTVPKRRRISPYCVPLRKFYARLKPDTCEFSSSKEFFSLIRPSSHNDTNRRVTFNICNVCSALKGGLDYDPYEYGDEEGYPNNNYKKRMTVELRLPESSLDPKDIVNWIRLFVRFVNLARIKFSPDDLSSLGLIETLQVLGLHGNSETAVILSRGLFAVKVWFLKRLMEYSDDKALKKEAASLLEYINSPVPVSEDTKNWHPPAPPRKEKPINKSDKSGKYDVFRNAMPPVPGSW